MLFVAFESNHLRCQNKLILIIFTQKDRSLKLRSYFLSQCKPLGTIIQFILFYKCSHFNPSYSFSSSVTVDFTKLLIFLLLFPFNSCWGFWCYVVDYPIYMVYFVYYSIWHLVQDLPRDSCEVGCHEVCCWYCTKG